ncbi:MAG: LacI family DNA-binding transcriptional regulator [Candidatus Excrementavichristensenella sp.]
MNNKVTIRDIAKVAGVSISTVSRVINNKGYISEAVRTKVMSAIGTLQYEPGSAIQSALKGNTHVVGVIVPEIDNPYISYLISAIEARLYSEGYFLMVCNSGYDLPKVKAFINHLISRSISHLIVIAMNFEDAELQTRINRHMEVIGINTVIKGAHTLNSNDWQTSFELTDYLISMGHRKIAFIGYNCSSPPTIERLRGYRDAMQKHNVPVPSDYILSSDYFKGKVDQSALLRTPNLLAAYLLDRTVRPTAIMGVNDYYALGVYSEAIRRGLVVGKDISVVGYDDISLGTIITPQLTTVHSNIESFAQMTMSLIHRQFSQKETSHEILNLIIPGAIRFRHSVSSAPVV